MLKLKIDKREIVAEAGTRLIEVARQNGIEIPSLCYSGDLPHYTSCLVCMVKDLKSGKFIASCSLFVEDGMDIDTTGDEVLKLRKEALSMLLSEHRAECEAPCKLVCPIGLNIPELNRLITKGSIEEAGELSFTEMGLPATICKLCPAYCENACRRKMIDHKIAIATLVKNSSELYLRKNLKTRKSSAKKVALIGGGASGLIAAHILSLNGHSVEIFEEGKRAGGSIYTQFTDLGFNIKSAEDEISGLLADRIIIHYNISVDKAYISDKLLSKFDAVVITTSELPDLSDGEVSPYYLQAEGDVISMEDKHIFLLGGAQKENRQFVRKIGAIKKAAEGISSFLISSEIRSSQKRFNSVIGKIDDPEKKEWLKEGRENSDRHSSPEGRDESSSEASNCLHCDCRASADCELRELCNKFEIRNPGSKFTAYPIEKKVDNSRGIIFEHAKCIKCGLCVRVMENGTNTPSLCFTGRGFMTLISEPLTYGYDDFNLSETEKAIAICPTGALTKREK